MSAGSLLDALVPPLRRYVDGRIAAAIADLEARLSANVPRHEGTWQPAVYDKGAFVTHHGSIWHCREKATGEPGKSDAWQLAVKRGRDGRDIRN